MRGGCRVVVGGVVVGRLRGGWGGGVSRCLEEAAVGELGLAAGGRLRRDFAVSEIHGGWVGRVP